jgi:hypothetical protein
MFHLLNPFVQDSKILTISHILRIYLSKEIGNPVTKVTHHGHSILYIKIKFTTQIIVLAKSQLNSK